MTTTEPTSDTATQSIAESGPGPITPSNPDSSPDDSTEPRDGASLTDETAGENAGTPSGVSGMDEDSSELSESIATEDDRDGEADDDHEHLDPAAEAGRLSAELADAIRRAERAEAATAKVRGEAQDLRRRLRGAEADRDEARAEAAEAARGTTRARQQEAEHVLADYLETPGDAWLDPAVDVDDMLDDDGSIDPARVDAVARGILDRHPSWQVDRMLPSLMNRRGVPWQLPPSTYRALRGGASARSEGSRPNSLGEVIRAGVNRR